MQLDRLEILISFKCCFGCSYFTNTLILPVINGPTEGLMIIYFSHFFTAIVGMTFVFTHKLLTLITILCMLLLSLSSSSSSLLLLLLLFYYTGAEWWAQPFGKSLPFLSWLPYLEGKTSFII